MTPKRERAGGRLTLPWLGYLIVLLAILAPWCVFAQHPFYAAGCSVMAALFASPVAILAQGMYDENRERRGDGSS